jgi:hypothetical protein
MFKVVHPLVVQAVQRAVLSLFPEKLTFQSVGSSASARLGTHESMADSLQDEALRQWTRSYLSSTGSIEEDDLKSLPPAAQRRNTACAVGGRGAVAHIEWVEHGGLCAPPATRLDGHRPFPSVYPRTLHRGDLAHLYDGTRYYCWTPKTHGAQTRLVCMRFFGKPLCVLLTRTWDTYVVRWDMPDEWFEGTMMDAELVQTLAGPALVVFDALMVAGRRLTQLVYLHRLQIAAAWLTAWARALEEADGAPLPRLDPERTCAYPVQVCRTAARPEWPLAVRVKSVFAPEEVTRVLLRCCPQLDHSIDGWILMASDATYRVGDGRDCFKLKLRFEHTIDVAGFFVDAGAKEEAKAGAKAGAKTGAQAVAKEDTKPSAQNQHQIQWLLRHGARWLLWDKQPATEADRVYHGKIVECLYDVGRRRWVPERLRLDKPHTNRPEIALSTWADVCEGIRLTEALPQPIVSAEDHARLAKWEQRAAASESTLAVRWTAPSGIEPDSLPIRKRYPVTLEELAARSDVDP